MRTTFVTVMVIFLKVSFLKLLDHRSVESSLPTLTRHIDNSVLKVTLQLKILLTWIKICAYSFIKTLVNIMIQKSTKLSGKPSIAQKFESTLQKIPNF